MRVCLCVCVCMCLRERERASFCKQAEGNKAVSTSLLGLFRPSVDSFINLLTNRRLLLSNEERNVCGGKGGDQVSAQCSVFLHHQKATHNSTKEQRKPIKTSFKTNAPPALSVLPIWESTVSRLKVTDFTCGLQARNSSSSLPAPLVHDVIGTLLSAD